MPKVTWRRPCGYFVSTVCPGRMCRIWKSLCGYFVAYLWSLPGVSGMGFRDQFAMAPHCSTLAWKIPWTEEPGGLPSLGSHGVGHDWSDLAAAAAAPSCLDSFQLHLNFLDSLTSAHIFKIVSLLNFHQNPVWMHHLSPAKPLQICSN